MENGSIGFAVFVTSPLEYKKDIEKPFAKISAGKMHPKPFPLLRKQIEVYVLGSPIWRNKADRQSVAELCIEDPFECRKLKEINGTFLIVRIDTNLHKVTIITDRFGSIPFFYNKNESTFFASTCYTDVWLFLKNQNRLQINPFVFYEFIHFQKLLGNKTFDRETACLDAASVLEITANAGTTCNITKYWQPSYKKSTASVLTNARKLSLLLKRSYEKYSSDNLRYGLLLSGGLDSRAVLASASNPLTCFTIGEFKNNEYNVAHLLANEKGCEHYFVQRSSNHYVNILKNAVRLGSCMNTFDHAHFLSLGEYITTFVDVVFHGHGLDYFFQGMYLPTEKVTFTGRPTFITRLKQIKGNLSEIFFNTVKYRLKDIDPLLLVKQSMRDEARCFVEKSVNDLAEEASHFCNDEYDIWEYMHVSNLSRHYTHLNLESIRTFVEERTVAFENELFNFYMSMPVEQRFNGKVFKKALASMSPELMKIRNANTNLKASYTPFQTTVMFYINRLLRKICNNALIPDYPSRQDRSWPDRDSLFRADKNFYAIACNLSKSERLEGLGIFDMDFVDHCITKHVSFESNYGALIATLITLDTFLSLS